MSGWILHQKTTKDPEIKGSRSQQRSVVDEERSYRTLMTSWTLDVLVFCRFLNSPMIVKWMYEWTNEPSCSGKKKTVNEEEISEALARECSKWIWATKLWLNSPHKIKENGALTCAERLSILRLLGPRIPWIEQSLNMIDSGGSTSQKLCFLLAILGHRWAWNLQNEVPRDTYAIVSCGVDQIARNRALLFKVGPLSVRVCFVCLFFIFRCCSCSFLSLVCCQLDQGRIFPELTSVKKLPENRGCRGCESWENCPQSSQRIVQRIFPANFRPSFSRISAPSLKKVSQCGKACEKGPTQTFSGILGPKRGSQTIHFWSQKV